MFNVLAKPTGPLCNLNCQYCYYLNKKNTLEKENSFVMSDAVLEAYTKNYLGSFENIFPEAIFLWQGGEPTLLGIEFFEKLIYYQKKHNEKKIKVVNTIQTNGTLLNSDWATFFRAHSCLVGISIDGPQSIHDYYRKTCREVGTFQKVHNGIQCLNKNGVEYNTLTTINNHNAEYFNDIYDYLKLSGSKYWQFIPIVEWQNDNKVTKESVQLGQYNRFLIGIFEKWLSNHDYNNIWIQLFDSVIGSCIGYPAQVCVYSQNCGNCLAMEHNGDVYSCDHFVDKEHLLGNIRKNTFTEIMNHSNHQKFLKYKNNLSDSCKKCNYIAYCYGGCPKHRSGKLVPENYLCSDYKVFFHKTLPVFQNMADCIKLNKPKNPHGPFSRLSDLNMNRNSRCSCGSGKKSKNCCR
jgi:uncharacterized protein